MLPNVVVIGSGKCGTSSLHHYLRQHPEIYMSRPKELRFFSHEQNWDRGIEWYESHFADASAPVCGEASPQYTHYPRVRGVPERMQSVIPDAKLIYLVRDPLERIAAGWMDNYSRRFEHRPLADAVTPFATSGLVSSSLYYMQLEEYLRFFPGEQVLVVQSEQLMRERRRTLQTVFRFLGVDDSFDTPAFDRTHHRSSRKRRIDRQWSWLPRSLEPAATGRLPWAVRARAKALVYRPFSIPVERPTIDGGLREALIEHLRPDIEELRRFTGMSFSDWSV